MKKVLLMVVVALLVYTTIDIWIWGYIFENESRYQTVLADSVLRYQWSWQLVLAGLIAVGTMALWPEKLKAFLFAFATLTLAHSGVEDIFYYWLNLKAVPTSLPWLDHSYLIFCIRPVTDVGLFLSAFIWIGFWATVIWLSKGKNIQKALA
jgi:hypothetical protein